MRNDPENFCPICGRKWSSGKVNGEHRCPERVIRAINAKTYCDEDVADISEKTFDRRLRDGFRFIFASGDR